MAATMSSLPTHPTSPLSFFLCVLLGASCYLAQRQRSSRVLPWAARWLSKALPPLREQASNGALGDSDEKRGPLTRFLNEDGLYTVSITKPLVLLKMEVESKVVTAKIARRTRLKSITGIEDIERLSEVIEEVIIPSSARLLSPNGLVLDPCRLSDFVGQHTFRAVSGSLFGATLPSELYPDYKIVATGLHLPPSSFWALPHTRRPEHAARGTLMKAMLKFIEEWWYADGLGQIEGASTLITKSLQFCKEEELTMEETAGCLLAILFEAHLNLWSTSFWLMAEVLSTASTYQDIVQEIRSTSDYNASRLLDSVLNEAFRWAPGAHAERHTTQDEVFTIDGVRYAIPGGSKLLLDMSACHYDEEIYPHPDHFVARRFMDDSLPLPRPFGEGKQMCKGAYLAKLQIKSFLAHILERYDIDVIQPLRSTVQASTLPPFISHLHHSQPLGAGSWGIVEDIHINVKPRS
ncbi:cytochrome P450 [Ephemerocybe angulata]|uniref:Cytochrome P450 n=1 Tax=Ephemerocybe angulata TaxID=980116 RepID=A0A8H6HYB0_9AGAR|nr:cytochrome P450 [Tulosesus angulatus]